MPEACMGERVPGGKKARIDSWVSTWLTKSTMSPCSTPRFAVSPVASISARMTGPCAFDEVRAAQERRADAEGARAHVPCLLDRVLFDDGAARERGEHAVGGGRGLVEGGRDLAERHAARGGEAVEDHHRAVERLDGVLVGLVVEGAGAAAGASFGHGASLAGWVRVRGKDASRKCISQGEKYKPLISAVEK